MRAGTDETTFRDALEGLRRGDFSRLEPLFTDRGPMHGPLVVEWLDEERFRDEPAALGQVLTCACFLGRVGVAQRLLNSGVAPSGGSGTGLDALHWAVNRGQLEAVRLLLRANAPLETRSAHGGTALGTAIWSAVHEPRRDHLKIIEELLVAGARVEGVETPTGNKPIDALLERYRPPTRSQM